MNPHTPVVGFRASRPAGATEFREGQWIRLNVPAPVIQDTLQVHTEPVLPTGPAL